jgi:hypothetical protein
MVSSFTRTSPSEFTFSVALKYDMTAWRLGALTGMNSRKSLFSQQYSYSRCGWTYRHSSKLMCPSPLVSTSAKKLSSLLFGTERPARRSALRSSSFESFPSPLISMVRKRDSSSLSVSSTNVWNSVGCYELQEAFLLLEDAPLYVILPLPSASTALMTSFRSSSAFLRAALPLSAKRLDAQKCLLR